MSKRVGSKELHELAAISKAEGLLRAQSVVEHARASTSALHRHFTWDDTQAAHEYRLEEARRLIRCAVALLPSVDVEYRAFVSLMSDRVRPGGGYRVTTNVLTDDARREELLLQALQQFERLRLRYKELTELTPVFAALDGVERRNAKRRTLRAAGA